MSLSGSHFVIDATVFVDYSTKAKLPHLDHVRTWFRTAAGRGEKMLTSPSVMFEFIKSLHYDQRRDHKTIRQTIGTFTSLESFEIVPHGDVELDNLLRVIDELPNDLTCHAGELSLLPLLKEAGTVFVSSDTNALRSFKSANRINPHFSPPVIARIGEEYKEPTGGSTQVI